MVSDILIILTLLKTFFTLTYTYSAVFSGNLGLYNFRVFSKYVFASLPPISVSKKVKKVKTHLAMVIWFG